MMPEDRIDVFGLMERKATGETRDSECSLRYPPPPDPPPESGRSEADIADIMVKLPLAPLPHPGFSPS